jgi:predicted O-linked N-acetylglucosamine transferase (SPINDLY family)
MSLNTLGATEFAPLIALYNTRRYAELESQAKVLLTTYPDAPFAWQLLGGALQMQGKDALTAFQKVAALSPNDAGAHFNLGVAFKTAVQLEAAVASYRQALMLNPHYVEVLSNLGGVLQDLGRFDEAVLCYRDALVLQPSAAGTQNSLGTALKNSGRLEEAVVAYRAALKFKADYADAYYNLGNALKELGRLDEAVQSYRQAVLFKPRLAEAHSNLGSVLKELGNVSEALLCYQRAIEIDPSFVEALSNLGAVFREASRVDEALVCFQKAAREKPHSLTHAIQAHLLLPAIPSSIEAIAGWRKRYQNGISTLSNSTLTLDTPVEQLSANSFYLAYHNSNDRQLMEALHQFFRERVSDLTFIASHITNWLSPTLREQRIKVGFLSEFLTDHTIGKHYKGFISHLNRNRFEVIVIHAPKAKHDGFRQSLDALADKTLTLPSKLKDQQQVVAAEQLDVLFYPDIGMSSTPYFLAYARLAPVQATSWGHPDTTGLDTMDYYVAATSNETENAQDNYTERLIRLNRLPCFYYQTPSTTIKQFSKAELGFPTAGTLYGCLQNLFKIHPDFDAVLADIAAGDKSGYIVFPEERATGWTELIKARWAKTFPILLERVVFMPRMNWDKFMAVLSHMDVLLDPLHFGSGNTFYDAMVFGTPVVTWSGQFGRGRNVAAAYQQMGITDTPIAKRLEDYAPLALALGRDPARRQALRNASLDAASKYLFEDMQAVREFESFLEDALAAAGRGEKLPHDWRPAELN